MQLTATQFEKLAGYFIDLAKVWFASGVIGVFVANTEQQLPLYILADSIIASAVFLLFGVLILGYSK